MLCVLFSIPGLSQSAHEHLLEGNEHYLNEDYVSAELKYRKSLEKEKSMKAEYNLGGAVYSQKRFDEAIDHFQAAANAAKTEKEKGAIYHNLGNSYLNAGKINESIDAYKQALNYLPDDKGSKYNLAMAQQIKRQQQQQKQEQEQQNQEQPQEKSGEDKEQKEEENQQQSEEQKQNQEENQESREEQENNEEQKMGSGEKEDMTKEKLDLEDALKLLQAIDNEDQKVQEKLRKKTGNKKKPDKDW